MRNGSKTIIRLAAVLAGAGLVLSFPSLAPNPYILSVGVVIANFAVLATAWNFVGGFTGYISLGHGALAGLGGYATALLITKLGLPSFVALFVAAALVAALAVPLGFAALRVRGASFVIVSIALVLILLLVFQSWSSVTGGSSGLVVPRPFPDLLRPEHHRVFYFLFAALLGVALLAWWIIDRSRFGLGLKAIREDEDKAESLGTPTFSYKMIVFCGVGGLHRTGGRAVRAVVRRPRPGLPVLDPDRRLLGVIVMFMPDGVIPAMTRLVARFTAPAASIREVSAEQLREETRS